MLVLRAARVFDGYSRVEVPRPVVVLDGRRIHAVVSADALDGQGLDQVDLGDVCLLPGLIDVHQHLVLDASATPVDNLLARDDEAVLDLARRQASQALMAGVTTVRDLGDRDYVLLALRDELAREPAQGPELLVAGPPITSRGGHCWFLGGEAEGEQGLRKAVRQHVQRGVDVIKVMVTGGGITPGSVRHRSQFDQSELRVLVEEAHRGGLLITGHAQELTGVADAVAAGLDGIEHCTFLTEAGCEVDPSVVRKIADAGTYVSITAASKVPVSQRVAADPDLIRELQNMISGYAALRLAGAHLCLSSDAGAVVGADHDSLPHGVVNLSLIGMAGEEALRTVTTTGAAACGIDQRKGRIAPGYDADLLAVRGDPMVDLASLRETAAVFRAGTRVR